jgi:hypothetical protein
MVKWRAIVTMRIVLLCPHLTRRARNRQRINDVDGCGQKVTLRRAGRRAQFNAGEFARLTAAPGAPVTANEHFG